MIAEALFVSLIQAQTPPFEAVFVFDFPTTRGSTGESCSGRFIQFICSVYEQNDAAGNVQVASAHAHRAAATA